MEEIEENLIIIKDEDGQFIGLSLVKKRVHAPWKGISNKEFPTEFSYLPTSKRKLTLILLTKEFILVKFKKLVKI